MQFGKLWRSLRFLPRRQFLSTRCNGRVALSCWVCVSHVGRAAITLSVRHVFAGQRFFVYSVQCWYFCSSAGSHCMCEVRQWHIFTGRRGILVIRVCFLAECQQCCQFLCSWIQCGAGRGWVVVCAVSRGQFLSGWLAVSVGLPARVLLPFCRIDISRDVSSASVLSHDRAFCSCVLLQCINITGRDVCRIGFGLTVFKFFVCVCFGKFWLPMFAMSSRQLLSSRRNDTKPVSIRLLVRCRR